MSAIIHPLNPRVCKALKAVEYRNEEITARYAKRNDVTVEYAEMLFEETLKFLATGYALRQTVSPSMEIDAMWHHFILHTKQYAEWCMSSFGIFIHHNPTETPTVENRSEILETARVIFGAYDASIWPTNDVVVACDSSCTGDDYCTETIEEASYI